MNRNYILAAIPFAVISDVALMVKAFTGYSDNTLMVVGIASAVITLLLVLKAFDKLTLPTFSFGSSTQPTQEVHNHYHYNRCDECDCDEDEEDEDCECRYTEEDLRQAREEGDEDGYRRGYDDGHDAGYDAGYAERKNEEVKEAEELARVILDLMEKKGVVKTEASPLSTVDSPAGSNSAAPQA